ncbi:prolyl oligopeptidase family serine peptidase [Oceanobacillus sp. ISL-73]|uniref:S9 family peptidase n=1 Tax=Oceanobacillus sp. ISL-73 TaxID=2819161 RepID=UPI001BE55502|nr:prolyl oligopeptidase family serine peptidase [Oceanobacillus sp. ISL-73]MBT2653244.1 S9 family peptidase [Oceanobacillus sp. ISL-73]
MIEFPKPTVEQFFRTYTISHFNVSKDENKLVFGTNINGTMNLWAMDLKEGSKFPYQFAQKGESSNFTAFDPEGRFVLTDFDSDGDENYQIYALPYEGGIPKPLITGNPDDKYLFSHLSEDGKRIYYNTSVENPSFFNTRVKDLENDSDTLIYEGEKGLTNLVAVSENEEAFVYIRMFANTYNNVFVQIGEETVFLTPDPEKVHVSFDPVFTDDHTVYFLTDYDSNYQYVAKFDLKSKKFEKVLALEEESLSTLKYHKESNKLYIVSEKGVVDKLYHYGLDDRQLVEINTPFDIVEQLKVMKSGNVYVLGRTATLPLNIFVSSNGEEWEQLTTNRVLGMDEAELVDPEVITYSSFDGMEIEALFFKAKSENANGYTVFWPHGGPQASERKFFRAMFQSILYRGYNIFAPNFRGSTGYGSEFVKMVERDWGYGPRLDNVEGIKWLFDQGISDPDHLFLVGGSYGGYMALLLHGRHPEYFKAVIDIFGPSNLFSFVESVPEEWKPIMDRWIGDPERGKERFIRDSPDTYLDTMTKPMLVIQGAKDPRVVKAESDQIVEKLKAKGRDVEYYVLEDEGHGFSKKENEIKVYTWMLDFLDKHQG